MSTKIHFRDYNPKQMILFPQRLDKDIAENDPVRVIDMVIDNLKLDNFKKLYKERGRSPYHPKMMLKAIIYGYMNNLYSCRKIETALKRDIHFIWLAGRNAFSEAFRNANPKILEPVYDVEVMAPSDVMGDVMSDLQSRRAIIMGMASENGFEKITAKVPLKEMSSYSTALSSITGGRSSFTMKFASYELVPGDVQEKLLKEYAEKNVEE